MAHCQHKTYSNKRYAGDRGETAMSMAGEIGGFVGRMAGVATDPLFLLEAGAVAFAGYRRFWLGMVIAPLLTVAVICFVNWGMWTRLAADARLPVVADLLVAHGTWSVLIFMVAAVAGRRRQRSGAV